jgi:uncharacterized coiled-coil DUF342 family protein
VLSREELLEKLREVNSQIDEIQRQIDAVTNEINARKALLEEIRKQLAEVRSLIEGKRQQLQRTRELIGSLVERKSQIINQIRSLRNELIQINIALQKYREKLVVYRNLLSTLNEYVGGKVLEKEKLKRIIEQLEYFFETSPTNPEWERQFIKYISQIEKELNLVDSMEKIKSHIAELKKQVDEYKNKREAIRSEIARLVQDLNTVKQELTQLKMGREVEEELEKYNVLLKALELSEKNKARAQAKAATAQSLKEKADVIYNKLLNGERLTHEEIKILIEAGYLPEE